MKEYYSYLDNTPTHAYMKYLYKYPPAPYPYRDLVETNSRRTRKEFEYELLDTGVFAQDRYFDVLVEYAKETPEDILVRITAANRGQEAAELHLLPTLWFRNTSASQVAMPVERPEIKEIEGPRGTVLIAATHPTLGVYHAYFEGKVPLLFTDNETNNARTLSEAPERQPKAQGRYQQLRCAGQQSAVNPAQAGAKASAHYRLKVDPCGSVTVRLRLIDEGSVPQRTGTQADASLFGAKFDEIPGPAPTGGRRLLFLDNAPSASEDEARVMRQAGRHAVEQATLLLRP